MQQLPRWNIPIETVQPYYPALQWEEPMYTPRDIQQPTTTTMSAPAEALAQEANIPANLPAVIASAPWTASVSNAMGVMDRLTQVRAIGSTTVFGGWDEVSELIHNLGPHAITALVPTPYNMEEAAKSVGEYDPSGEFSHVLFRSMMRGQNGDRWDVHSSRQSRAPWFNYTFFPVIKSSVVTNSVVFSPELFLVGYSSIQPPDALVGHETVWSPLSVTGTSTKVFVDVALLSDSNSILSITAALLVSHPQEGSYVWFSHISQTKWFDKPLLLAGASMGLATAACVIGAPSVMYTGYIRRSPADDVSRLLTPSQAEKYRAQHPGFPDSAYQAVDVDGMNFLGVRALRTDDMVEDVQLVGMKALFALSAQFPVVIPHKSHFNGPLENIILSYRRLAGFSDLQGGLVSTVQTSQAYDYLSHKSPLLLATTLTEAVYLGGLAYIAYVTHPALGVRYTKSAEQIGNLIRPYANQIYDEKIKQRAAAADFKREPEAYVQRRLAHREDVGKAQHAKRVARTDAKSASFTARMAKAKVTGAKAAADRLRKNTPGARKTPAEAVRIAPARFVARSGGTLPKALQGRKKPLNVGQSILANVVRRGAPTAASALRSRQREEAAAAPPPPREQSIAPSEAQSTPSYSTSEATSALQDVTPNQRRYEQAIDLFYGTDETDTVQRRALAKNVVELAKAGGVQAPDDIIAVLKSKQRGTS